MKAELLVLSLIVIFGVAGVAYGVSTWFFGNQISEHVKDFSLTMTSTNLEPYPGENVSFTVTVLYNGQNAGAGLPIVFFHEPDHTVVGNVTTNSSGMALWSWLADSNSTFEPGYQAP